MVFQHLPTFSSVLQHIPASLSMNWKGIDALWRAGMSVPVCVCVVVLFYVANHLHFFAVCTAWPFIQRLHSFILFLQLLQISSERGGWSVDVTFAGNSCCNPCWVLRWCGLFASETYIDLHDVITCNYCAWSQHLVEKVQELGTQIQSCGSTQWLTMCPMESQ